MGATAHFQPALLKLTWSIRMLVGAGARRSFLESVVSSDGSETPVHLTRAGAPARHLGIGPDRRAARRGARRFLILSRQVQRSAAKGPRIVLRHLVPAALGPRGRESRGAVTSAMREHPPAAAPTTRRGT